MTNSLRTWRPYRWFYSPKLFWSGLTARGLVHRNRLKAAFRAERFYRKRGWIPVKLT